ASSASSSGNSGSASSGSSPSGLAIIGTSGVASTADAASAARAAASASAASAAATYSADGCLTSTSSGNRALGPLISTVTPTTPGFSFATANPRSIQRCSGSPQYLM